LSHPRKSAPDVRDRDGAADDECYVERVDHFFALPAFFGAAHQMVCDAVVAAKDCRRDEAEKFLRLCADGTGFIRLMIEGEEALHAEMAAAENFLVQVSTKLLKIV